MNKIPFIAAFFTFSQVQAFNLPQTVTQKYNCEKCSVLSHELLSDHWTTKKQVLKPAPGNSQKSYSYTLHVNAKELHQGVTVTTSASQALIRISALQNQALPTLGIKTADKTMSLSEASSLYHDNQSLDGAFTPHQRILQLKPELGSGSFMLKSEEEGQGLYSIRVFDKYSSLHLDVASHSLHYQYGEKVSATIQLADQDNPSPIENITAFLIGPHGENIPMEIKEKDDDTFEASTVLSSKVNPEGKNWYIEVNTISLFNDEFIQRSAYTAFSYAIPSANMVSVKKVSSHPLTFEATINTEIPSRYALQAVLFNQNNNQYYSIGVSQTAQWVEAGTHTMQFTFDNSEQLAEDDLYLGDLAIIDYGQFKRVFWYDGMIKLAELWNK